MNLDVYNTHMELYPYTKDDYPWIEDYYTAIDKFTQLEFPCGYIIENGKLYIPRGSPLKKIEATMKTSAVYKTKSDPRESMSRRFSSLYDLRDDIQQDAVNFLMNNNRRQLALNLATGLGKTFVVCYTTTKLNEKTIIITHNEGIKQQWINTYHKMFDYRPKNLMNISGSNIIECIMRDEVDSADVYFVNHQTLRSYMTQHNGYTLHKFFKKIKVGIKVYDESHLEFANILLLDFFSNTYRTWYLTATFDRSDKTESKCFRRAFESVEAFGEEESKDVVERHVIYHVVNINSRATPSDKAKVMGWNGMSAISYGRYAFHDDTKQTAYQSILAVLEKTKELEGKTLIFVPLIETVDELVKKLKLDHPEKTISSYHSKISKEDKDSAIKKDIIVSTIRSCGTGRDIPGLRVLICAEPIASKVVAQQMFGRLRPYKDKMTYFFDIIDISIPTINWWFRARFKKIQELAKDVVYLNLDK